MSDNNINIKLKTSLGNTKSVLSKASKSFRDFGTDVKKSSSGYSDFIKNNKKLNDSFSNISRDANRSAKGIMNFNKSFGSLKKTILSSALAFSLSNATNSAIEMIETINLYNIAMGEYAESTNEAILKTQKLTGLDLTNLQNAVGTFNLLARSMGFSQEKASVLSENVNRLSIDLASLVNVSTDQARRDIKAGLLGQSETMYKYGVDVTEMAIKQEALRRGITKSVRQMTQGEKMMLRYSVMLRQTALSHGDFARNVETPANQLKILQERFVTLTRSIGTLFIPILGAVLPYLNAVLSVITMIIDKIARLIGYKPAESVRNTTGGFGELGDSIEDADSKLGGANKKAKEFKKTLAGFDEITIIGQKDTGKSGAGAGVGGGGSPLDLDVLEYDSMFEGIQQKSDKIVQGILDGLNMLGIGLEKLYNDYGGRDIMLGIKKGIAEVDFSGMLDNMKRAMGNIWDIFTESIVIAEPMFKAQGEMIGTLLKQGITIVGNIFDPIIEGFANFTDNMKPRMLKWVEESTTQMRNGYWSLETVFDVVGQSWIDSLIKFRPQIVEESERTFTNIAEKTMLKVKVITGIFESITGAVEYWVLTNSDKIEEFSDGVIESIVGMWNLINNVWEDSLIMINDWWDEYGKKIVGTVTSMVLDIGGWIMDLWMKRIKPTWDTMVKTMNSVWDSTLKDIVKNLMTMVGEVATLIGNLWNTILKPLVDLLTGIFYPVFEKVFSNNMKIVKFAVESIGKYIKTLQEVLNGLLKFVNGVFEGNWSKAWEGIVQVFGSVFEGIVNFAKKPLNVVISLINNVIRSFNKLSFDIPDWVPVFGGESFGFNIREVPRLARGGSLMDGMLFEAGEGGKAELMGNYAGKTTVMPLEDSGFTQAMGRAVYDAMISATSNMGGNSSGGTVQVLLDGRVIAEEIANTGDRDSVINGRNVFNRRK